MDYRKYLRRALDLAKVSLDKGSVPIGAVIVDKEENILAEGFSEIKISHDPTAHAEVMCMRRASEKIIAKLNPESTYLFTTLEPCFACGYFITRTNIKNVIWALNDPYKGGMEFLRETDKLKDDYMTINLMVEPDSDMAKESKMLLRSYYLGKGKTEIAKLFT